MPFIGTQPEVGGYSVLDALTASATASYTLQLNSANFVPASANQLLVSLNGVIQKPGSSFTVSGSTLTFSSALTSSDSIDFIISMGEPLLIGTPSDNTITTNKLVNDSVTGAKIENNPTIAGNLTVSGNTAASGTLTSTGLITASAGVAIGGTGSANTLDDYEEGTWTPSLGGNTTYHAQVGKYTKVGNVVHCGAVIQANVLGTGSTTTVSGFPFTSSHAGSGYCGGDVGFYYFGAVNVMSLDVQMGNNATTTTFSGRSSAGGTISSSIAFFGNGARIDFSITYYVA